MKNFDADHTRQQLHSHHERGGTRRGASLPLRAGFNPNPKDTYNHSYVYFLARSNQDLRLSADIHERLLSASCDRVYIRARLD